MNRVQIKYCPKCAAKLKEEIIEGIARRVCHTEYCRYIYWNNPIPVVAALVIHEGTVILARNARWPKSIYSSISGYLEENETPEVAVVRELKEELGLDAQVVEFIGHYYFKEKNQLLIGYTVTASGEVRLNHELADIKRLDLPALREYDFHPLYITQAMVKDWLDRLSARRGESLFKA